VYRWGAILGGVAAALTLAGCVNLKGEVVMVQTGVMGDIHATFTLCASGNDDDDSTPELQTVEDHPGCTGGTPADSPRDDVQILVIFHLSPGTTVPASFSTVPGSGPAVTFHRNAQLEEDVESGPNPEGFDVFAYVSEPYDFDDGDDEVPAQQGSFELDFGLPPGPGGAPFAGPFRYIVQAGFRNVADPATPFDCYEGPSTDQSCFSAGTTLDGTDVPTRDLGIVPGAPATVAAGSTGTLQFDARWAGVAGPQATFSLGASTGAPGATATPSRATLVPAADSSNPVSVSVDVPSSTPAGTYDVTLFASIVNAERRQGSTSITVTPDVTAPAASGLSLSPKRFFPFQGRGGSIARTDGTRVGYTLSEPARMRFTLERAKKGARKGRRCVKRRRNDRRRSCRRFVKLRGSFERASSAGENSFRFTGRLRGKPLKPGTYRLTGRPTDPAGNAGASARARFKIRRPR
jgi:hypothetical protein